MLDQVQQIARQVLDGKLITRRQACELIAIDGDDVYDLFYWANKIRIQYKGRDVRFCAIVAAKAGGCSEDCKFCAQSSHYQTAVQGQSKLTDEQVIDSALHAGAVGADSFGIVNSGRGPTRGELEGWIGPLLQKIARSGKTRACATLGALTPETAQFLFDNGVRRINHNLETSERFYPQIVGTHPYSERLNTLRIAKEAGLSLCSGGIFGMGEDWEDRLDMIFTLRDIGVDVMPVNFLNAIPGTPLEDQPKLHPMECLKMISICRFIYPGVELKVAGGREVCLRDLQSWIFFAGADSTMIGNYLTTYGRSPELDHQMVHDLGLNWRVYEHGPVEPSSEHPQLSRISHTGRFNIPILYEGEITVNEQAATTVLKD
ncbi:MAG TPA: biotin synthase BioB [Phycisphaerae bacterium]|nr:biotin synthase BioB [Phycisphaerae bacterium]